MKTSLKYLPLEKQQEIEKIALTIHKNYKEVEKIILFGSYARGNYKEAKDLEKDRKSGHVSDYDILVVTATKKIALDSTLWGDISKKCKELALSADPRIIAFDIDALNVKLIQGQYFYRDIKKEGILIFDAKNSKLERQRELTNREYGKIAKEEFDEWFGSAKEFFIDYNNAFNRQSYKKAAFELHQSAEHAYKAIHLVFTNYCPNEHYLKTLSGNIEECHNDLGKLFSQNTDDKKRRVLLLEYAYIGGRYDSRFYISKEDLEILVKDVERLLEITKEICEERIKKLLDYGHSAK
jgi:predicted nucleotidyltransferase/HEPN domain-containing protein